MSPASPAFKPPARDLTADYQQHHAMEALDAALANLRLVPPGPEHAAERALLVQQCRNARRTLQGYRIGQPEGDEPSPASLARIERIRAAQAEALTHSGRSPQHEDPKTGICGRPFRAAGRI